MVRVGFRVLGGVSIVPPLVAELPPAPLPNARTLPTALEENRPSWPAYARGKLGASQALGSGVSAGSWALIADASWLKRSAI